MTDYTDRQIVQLAGGTAALRATLTLGERELWVDVDGGGAPTGDLWLGDGATLGGLGPLRVQANVDHGALAGLGDDDHTQYVLADGSRAMDSLQVNGTALVLGVTSITNVVQILTTSPSLFMGNTTETDADGGRVNVLRMFGEDSGGTLHGIGEVRAEHDGAGADQKSRMVHYVNTGAGLVEALRMASDLKATAAGQLVHTHGRFAAHYRSTGQTLTNVAPTFVTLQTATQLRLDTGFAFSAGVYTCSFAGTVLLSHNAGAGLTTGTRCTLVTKWQVDVGGVGTWVDVPGSLSLAYLRTAVAGATASCPGVPLVVASGDKLRLVGASDTASTTITTTLGGLFTKVQRIQDPT